MSVDEVVAEELTRYLSSSGGAGASAGVGPLCAALSRLLQGLMEREPDWDARYTWLDGIVPTNVSEASPDGIELIGGAYVVNGERCALRPVHAELRQPPAKSTLRLASPDAEIPCVPGGEKRLAIPADPAKWAYTFEVELPA